MLSSDDPLSKGANRSCYAHPTVPGLCIKLDQPAGQGTRRGMNRIEFAHYKRLDGRLGESFYRHAPRCEGWVETNLGRGLCFERIFNADGSPAARFDQCLASGGCSVQCAVGMVDRLYVFVTSHRAGLFDVNLHNLLVRRVASGGSDLVAIDWKGPAALREFIPASRYFLPAARRKIARRFGRLREQVRERSAAASIGSPS